MLSIKGHDLNSTCTLLCFIENQLNISIPFQATLKSQLKTSTWLPFALQGLLPQEVTKATQLGVLLPVRRGARCLGSAVIATRFQQLQKSQCLRNHPCIVITLHISHDTCGCQDISQNGCCNRACYVAMLQRSNQLDIAMTMHVTLFVFHNSARLFHDSARLRLRRSLHKCAKVCCP